MKLIGGDEVVIGVGGDGLCCYTFCVVHKAYKMRFLWFTDKRVFERESEGEGRKRESWSEEWGGSDLLKEWNEEDLKNKIA